MLAAFAPRFAENNQTVARMRDRENDMLDTLESCLQDQLKDIYNAEAQLTKALPRMAKAASDPQLQEAFEMHLEETRAQIERLDQVGAALGFTLKGKKCKGMEGLIEEGKEVTEEDGEGAVIDCALIAAAQKVEHYEISAYGSARALAEQLGHTDVVELLQQTLEEESATDEKLTQISQQSVLPQAGMAGEEEEEEEESGTNSGNGKRRSGKSGGRRRSAAASSRR
jgi:ferritin-like metal-binding protein YciE